MRRQRVEYLSAHATTPKLTKADRFKKFYREVKRKLIADGRIADPSQRPKKWQYHWTIGDRDEGGIVYADHTGEARGLIKKALGIKKGRLPECIKFVRIPNDETSSPGDLPFSIGQVQAGTNPHDLGGTP